MEDKLIEALESILTAPAKRITERRGLSLVRDIIVIELPVLEFKTAEITYWKAKGYTEESAIAEKMREFNDSA